MNAIPEQFLDKNGMSRTFNPKDFLSSDNKGISLKKESFSFISVKELKQKMKPVQWLIKDYLEEHTMALMFGDPACGKSFLAIDMACCAASGTSWHGKAVKQGAVFYIAGEGHNGLGRRVKAWEQHNGVCLDGVPLYFAERAAQLYDGESAVAVADAVQGIAEAHNVTPSLIVIDTLARNFGGGNENDTKDMNVFVQNIDGIKNRWNAAVLIVHHTGHADKSRARGAMALKGALDHEYQVAKNADGLMILTSTKSKESPDAEALYFRLEQVYLPPLEDGTLMPDPSAAIAGADKPLAPNGKKISGQKGKALNVLQNLLAEKGEKRTVRANMPPVVCVTLEQFRAALKQHNLSNSDNLDSVSKAVTRAMDGLNNSGITVSYGEYIWMPDKQDKAGQTKNQSFARSGQTGQKPIGLSCLSGADREIKGE